MATASETGYPIKFSVDYPDRSLNRVSTLFRGIVAIPIAIVFSVIGSGALFTAPLLMILFRRKYPRWWFDWEVNLAKFANRVEAYLLLLVDEYPSTDEEQAIHLEVPYPDAERDLNRWLPLIKWILAIPHYIVLIALSLVSVVVVIAAWFAILFTGRYPSGLFNFIVGVQRWYNRVWCYSVLLVTDKYPPFSLAE